MRNKLLFGSIVLSLALFTGCSQDNLNNEKQNTNSASENTVTNNGEGNSINKEAVEEAIKAAQEYKNIEYTVENSEDVLSEDAVQSRNEELKPFLTESFYTNAVDTRYTTLLLTITDKQKLSIKPENLKFNLVDDKNDIIELRYNVDLVLIDQGDKESKRVPLEGILTLKNVNDNWLVQGDRYDSAAFNKLTKE
jgi:outer membrane murein-binding lipoprotein Lpp